jgi:hypothetical protein
MLDGRPRLARSVTTSAMAGYGSPRTSREGLAPKVAQRRQTTGPIVEFEATALPLVGQQPIVELWRALRDEDALSLDPFTHILNGRRWNPGGMGKTLSSDGAALATHTMNLFSSGPFTLIYNA